MKKYTVIALILALAVIFSLTACNVELKKEKAVYIGTTAVIEKAVRGEYNYDMLASGNSEIPLVWQDGADHEYKPLLASYQTVGNKTWTYTVQQGMTWSDGKPVTAEDILFTLNYDDANGEAVFNDKTATDGKVTEKKYKGYALSADKKSISLTLVTENARELSNMTSFRIMPKHVYEGKNEITDADGRVVCGPFVLESFNKEAGVLTYKVNPYYPQKPKIEKLVYRIFGNEDLMYMALKNGDIDTVWAYSQSVNANYYDVLKEVDGLDFIQTPAVGVRAVVMFNTSIAPFNDGNLRKAVSYALDYEAFKNTFGSAGASVANRGFVPTSVSGAKQTEKLKKDYATAAEYLKKSGYVKANGGKYYKKDGAELEFALTVRSSNATHLRYAELVKNNLEDFGIKVNLDAVDSNTFNVKTSNKFSSDNGVGVSHQAAINGFTEAGMGMKDGFASIYVDKSHPVQGGCQVDDEVFSGILENMRKAKTKEEYNAAAGSLQDYYADNVPIIALYWDNLNYVHSSKLSGLKTDAVFGINNVVSWLNADISER